MTKPILPIIKFRGKRLDNGEYVYGLLVKNVLNKLCIQPEFSEDDFSRIVHPVEYESIGQFTGAKDKKGNEIYFGDIIEVEYAFLTDANSEFVWRGVVLYSPNLGFYLHREDRKSGPYSLTYGGSAIKRFEVVHEEGING